MKAVSFLPLSAFALLLPTASVAADYCAISGVGTFFPPNTVTSTFSSNSWANSSARRVSSDLSSTAMTGIEIRAVDSPVTLYVYSGSELDGDVSAVHCDQGLVCTAHWSATIGSVNCQRDFGHKSVGTMWDLMQNPILPIGDAVTPLAGQLESAAEANYWVEDLKDTRVNFRWRNGRDFDSAFGFTTSWGRRYDDHLHLRLDATIDPNWWAADYDVSIDYWMGPVLDGDSLELWWAGTSINVEEGTLQGLIAETFESEIAAADLQGLINAGIVNAVDEVSFGNSSLVLGGKTRLQLSHVSDFAASGGADWMPWTSTSSTAPDIHLNATRTAN